MFDTQKIQPITKFNTEEILKLRGLLDTLTKLADSSNCSLGFEGNIPHSGARDHMTQSSIGFISYRSCPSNKMTCFKCLIRLEPSSTWMIYTKKRLAIFVRFYQITFYMKVSIPNIHSK